MRKKADGKSIPNAFLNIVGQNTLQNELLLSFLKKETGLKGKCFPTLESMPPIDENEPAIPQLLLLDCRSIDMKNIWEDIRAGNFSHGCPCFFILCNAEAGSGIEKTAMDNNMQGIFYNNDPPHSISKGVGAVLRGDFWYPRKTMKKMLKGERFSSDVFVNPTASRLTAREKQVLVCMASGYTGKAIADDLEISSHTVKNHVYNIYKKINVTNRLQASLWAVKYL